MTELAQKKLPPNQDDDVWLKTARTLTHTLDKRHLDPILGFCFPFVGDVVGGLLGAYLLVLAWRKKKPRLVLARMALNTAIDTGLGAIPILGDLFDYWFRANSRNLKLLERPTQTTGNTLWDSMWLALSLVLLLAALCLPLVLLGAVIYTLWSWR